MHKREKVKLKDWQSLYQEAIKFRDLKCWEYMYDSDLFAVQNPKTGEIGYVCVLGNLGEVFGLNVYLGQEGLNAYILQSEGGQTTLSYADTIDQFISTNKCLSVYFKDRNNLSKEDLALIKKLGLKLRGKNKWPLFRFQEPGYFPWYLNKEQLEFLTIILQQANIYCREFKKNPNLYRQNDNKICLRVLNNNKWENQETALFIEIKNEEKPSINELAVKKIKKGMQQLNSIWELDLFFTPSPVQDKVGARPYYPYCFFMLEQSSEVIICTELLHIKDYREKVIKKFLNFVQQKGAIPKEIWVTKNRTYLLFKDLTEKLGIDLKKVEEFKSLQEARQGLLESMVNM